MSDVFTEPPKGALQPIDRVSEVLFGLIMVLTFTGSLSVADAGRDDVRAMLIGAIGCNLAWGIIDGLFYLMGCLADKAHGRSIFLAVRRSGDVRQAQRLVAASLPTVVASVLQPAELQAIQQRLTVLPEPPQRARLSKGDWRGALAACFWVFLSTFPVVIPFIFMDSVAPAMRVSNAIAIILLFISGYLFGRMTGYRPWLVGVSMVFFGAVLVGMTIFLGG